MLLEADPVTAGHSDDVELLSGELCRRLGITGEELETALLAARLHDVGKVAVPRDVLEKPGPLNETEWKLVREHTVVGERILASIPELAAAAKLVRHSHEHFDGSGYPDGLSGEEIPLGSRIILCADAFHAIRSDRPYRCGRKTPEALAEIERAAGSQFDPRVVAALAESVAAMRAGRNRRLPRRLVVLLATLAIGTGGAYAAERGWVPSPIPGVGPERAEPTATETPAAPTGGESEATGDESGAAPGPGDAAKPGRQDGRDGDADSGATSREGKASSFERAPGGGEQTVAGAAGVDASGGDSSAGASTGASAGGGSTGGESSGADPGGSGTAPGHSGSAPGQTGSAPGQIGATPGQSGSTPSGGGAPPGQSGSAPGLSGSTPGQSGANPGQGGGPPVSPPGNSGSAPGRGGVGGNPHG
jgi:hypothetical protein